LFLLIFFAWLGYYAFAAVSTGLYYVDEPARHLWLAGYSVIGLCALVSPIIYRRLSNNGWPNALVKYTVHTLIAVFLGQFAMAAVMFVGDLLIGIKAVFTGLHMAWAVPALAESTVISRSPFVGQLAMLSGGLLFLGLLYGVTRRYRYQVRTVQVPINGLPKAFHGLRVVQLSDIHSGSFDNPAAVRRGVDKVM